MNTATNKSHMSFIIDTLQFSKRMHKAGLKQEIAEELAELLKESQVKSLEDLVTKQDLKIQLERLEYKLTLKMFFMLSAAVGAITWLDKVIN